MRFDKLKDAVNHCTELAGVGAVVRNENGMTYIYGCDVKDVYAAYADKEDRVIPATTPKFRIQQESTYFESYFFSNGAWNRSPV